MSGSCVFVAHGLRRENMRLQPWRYVYELAVRFAARQPVVIVTDADGAEREEEWVPNLKVVFTGKLSPQRGRQLAALIARYDPAQIWWSTTPRSLVYQPVWKRLNRPVTAMVTCPLYPWRVLLRAWAHGVPWDEIGGLVRQRLIPRWLFVKMLSRHSVAGVVTQSAANRDVLIAAGVPGAKVKVIPVGIDEHDREPVAQVQIEAARTMLGFPAQAKVFLYLGAVRRIRGIYALLDAFPLVAQLNPHVYLGVLARGADEKLCEAVRAYSDRLGIGDRVKVVGGWLSREQVWANIETCDVVTLPFVVVPSDVPIAILEALARGKPVIGSDVDGIPELVSGRGAVVDPLDKNAMANAMLAFAESTSYLKQMGDAAQSFMANYPDWNRVGELALASEIR